MDIKWIIKFSCSVINSVSVYVSKLCTVGLSTRTQLHPFILVHMM